MKINEFQEDSKFRQTLTDFLIAGGIIFSHDFHFDYDPCRLYQLVCRRGGFQVCLSTLRLSSIGRSGPISARSSTSSPKSSNISTANISTLSSKKITLVRRVTRRIQIWLLACPGSFRRLTQWDRDKKGRSNST